MITLTFKESKSKNYKKALELASEFSDVRHKEDTSVMLPIKEIFEKWDMFASLFLLIVNWKGMTLNYDGMTYHSFLDKKRLFYALQMSKMKYLFHKEDKVMNSYKVVLGEWTQEKLDHLTPEEADRLIELFELKKHL